MDRVELPDGAWAELYEPKKIPERRRKLIQRNAVRMQKLLPEKYFAQVEVTEPATGETPHPAFGAPPVDELMAQTARRIDPRDLTDETLDAMGEFDEALVLGYVTTWSFGDELTVDAIRDLPVDQYDALVAECRDRNAAADKKADPT